MKKIIILVSLVTLFSSIYGLPDQNNQKIELSIKRIPQPDGSSCGPASLKIALSAFGDDRSTTDIVKLITLYKGIGSYDSHVAIAAMELGYTPVIYSFNRRIFHPKWNNLSAGDLLEKLRLKRDKIKASMLKPDSDKVQLRKDLISTEGYISFMEHRGEIKLPPLSKDLIINHLKKGEPVIAALDMSYLYESVIYEDDDFDPNHTTHFVVIYGYDPATNDFNVADPWYKIPLQNTNGLYVRNADFIVNAILHADFTNDADIIVIKK